MAEIDPPLKVGDNLTFPEPFGCTGQGPHKAIVTEWDGRAATIEFERLCSDGQCPASKWVKRG